MSDSFTFVPKEASLSQVLDILAALRDPTRQDHQLAVASLDHFIAEPDFVLHLLHLFVHGSRYNNVDKLMSPETRQLAGLVVKNYVCHHLRLPSYPIQVQLEISQGLREALSDTIPDIQNTAAIAVGKMARHLPSTQWMELLTSLLRQLELVHSHDKRLQVSGALKAIKIICEDCAEQLCGGQSSLEDHCSLTILSELVPRLGATLLVSGQDEAETFLRLDALACLNALLAELPVIDEPDIATLTGTHIGADEAIPLHLNGNSGAVGGSNRHRASVVMAGYLGPLLQAISPLASDRLPAVRRAVCRCVQLLSVTFGELSSLSGQMLAICRFMLLMLQDLDESVAIEACDFWGSLAESSTGLFRSLVEKHLRELLPLLVSRMRLTEAQMRQERADAVAEASGEKEVLFRPIHRRGDGGISNREGDDDGIGSNHEGDASGCWTLRMEAARLLDGIGMTFEPSFVLTAALPAVEACLRSVDDVWAREAGMLALGALSKGCLDQLAPYLPQLYPCFLQQVDDPVLEVRCISCWTLSRYCAWLFDPSNESGHSLFEATLAALARRLHDDTPKVQAAACTALSALCEQSGDEVAPYLGAIFTSVLQCFSIYGVKSTMQLFDLIGALADASGDYLADPNLTPLYLPSLMSQLRRLDDGDMHLFPVLECLACVASAAKCELLPYAQEVIIRCLRIANNTLSANAAVEAGAAPEDSAPVKDFAVCAIDVLSGLCEGLQGNFQELLLLEGDSGVDSLVSLLLVGAHDTLPELRQSVLMMAGEMAKSSPLLLMVSSGADRGTGALRRLLEACLLNIDSDREQHWPNVCSNAVWAVGEIALRYGGGYVEPLLGRLCTALIHIMRQSGTHITLRQNIGITFGTLLGTNADTMIGILPECFPELCDCLKLAPADCEERSRAFSGVVGALSGDPTILLGSGSDGHVRTWMLCCASWAEPPEEPLRAGMAELLMSLQRELGPVRWRGIFEGIDAELRNRLQMFIR